MSSEKLSQILILLHDEDSRWEGIMALKSLDYPGLGNHLVNLLSDSEWIVRWCVAEKLGDMELETASSDLVNSLNDQDPHVRKNVIKALYKIGLPTIPYLIPQFSNTNPQVRRYITTLLMKFGKPSLDYLESSIEGQNWVVSNRIVESMWKVGGVESERYLIRQLINSKVQKNVINLLGFIPSNKCVRALIKAFQFPPLKRTILHTLRRIGKEDTYPLLIRTMFDKDKNMAKMSRLMVVKIGESGLPFIMSVMPEFPQHRDFFLKLISKISPGASKIIQESSGDETQLKYFVNQLQSRLTP